MTLAGAVFVLSAALAVSGSLLSKGKRRIEVLDALCKLIEYIKQNIDTFGTPVGEIVAHYGYSVLDKYAFGDAMRKDGLCSAAVQKLLPIGEEAQNDLAAFAENIGEGYRDEEVRRCGYYLSRFEAHLAEEKEHYAKNIPLYRYLPLLAGVSALILLI